MCVRFVREGGRLREGGYALRLVRAEVRDAVGIDEEVRGLAPRGEREWAERALTAHARGEGVERVERAARPEVRLAAVVLQRAAEDDWERFAAGVLQRRERLSHGEQRLPRNEIRLHVAHRRVELEGQPGEREAGRPYLAGEPGLAQRAGIPARWKHAARRCHGAPTVWLWKAGMAMREMGCGKATSPGKRQKLHTARCQG